MEKIFSTLSLFMRPLHYSLLLLSLAMISGCGGGDSSVDQNISADDTTTDVPAGDTTTDVPSDDTSTGTYFLPYSGGSLYIVNAQDFSDVRLVTSSEIEKSESVFSAAYSATSGIYEVGNPAYVVYIADGHIYKKSLTDGDSSPIQLSSASGVTNACNMAFKFYLADIEQSPVFYTLPGADSTCSPPNETYLVHLNTPISTSPKSVSGMPEMEIYDFTDGSLGLIFLDAGNVKLYDYLYENPVTIATGISMVTEIGPAFGDPVYNLVQLDSDLHFIDKNGTTSPSVHTLTSGHYISEWQADDDTLYFFEESSTSQKGWKLPLDGSTNAIQFFEDLSPIDYIVSITLTTNKIVIERGDQLLGIDKSSTLSSPIIQELLNDSRRMIALYSYEDRIYYTLLSSSADSSIIDENGNLLTTHTNSAWFGAAWSWTLATSSGSVVSAIATMEYILLAENFSGNPLTSGFLDASLKSIHLADGVTVNLGTLTRPVILTYSSLVTGLGGDIDPTSPTASSDVFAVDAKAGLFQYITDTPTISEWPAL